MTYEEALEFIHSTLKFGSRPGLICVTELLKRLFDPQKDLKFIHVAGTNGKGSTVTYLAEIYGRAGYKTGKYISPYLEDFCERISIDGERISGEDVARYTEKIAGIISGMVQDGFSHPTEFEIITAMAFCYFKEKNCEVVVLEAGLGGRLDATNVISPPLASVITSISYDHMHILGDTLSDIAYEKCGIIKTPSPVILYPIQAEEVFAKVKSAAKKRKCPLILPDICAVEIEKSDLSGSVFSYKGERYEISLSGEHQVYNAVTALETVFALEKTLPVSGEKIKAGLKNAFFPARLELLGENPLFVLDGAHNEDGMRSLLKVIDRELSSREITVVFGMLRDKDYALCIPRIAKRAARFIATCPENPRRLFSSEVAAIAKEFCADVRGFDDPKEALCAAISSTPPEGAIVVCGSLYLAGVLRSEILRHLDKKRGKTTK